MATTNGSTAIRDKNLASLALSRTSDWQISQSALCRVLKTSIAPKKH
ncbi:hypothetical protein [Bathymodiolus platifrons methanotrophic gill symbiont]|nr:hypothetical protein [Bathymodiolus platifrons methanotrophic gill symbiont]